MQTDHWFIVASHDVVRLQLNQTENFDERRKIRARLREVREIKSGESRQIFSPTTTSSVHDGEQFSSKQTFNIHYCHISTNHFQCGCKLRDLFNYMIHWRKFVLVALSFLGELLRSTMKINTKYLCWSVILCVKIGVASV